MGSHKKAEVFETVGLRDRCMKRGCERLRLLHSVSNKCKGKMNIKVEVLLLILLAQCVVVKSTDTCDSTIDQVRIDPEYLSNPEGPVQVCNSSNLWQYDSWMNPLYSSGNICGIIGCTGGTPLYCYPPHSPTSCSSSGYIYTTYTIGVRCAREQPTTISSSHMNSSSISISWTPPTYNCSSYYSASCGSETTTVQCSNQCTATITGLQHYTSYNCCVLAQYGAGLSQATCGNYRTLQERPSSPQVSVVTTATSATISWSRPANARGPLWYTGGYYTNELCSGDTHNFTTNDTTFLVNSLCPFTTYNYCIRANNLVGKSSQVCGPFNTMESAPSGIPTVSLRRVSSRSISLIWSELLQSQRNGIIIGYTIEVEPLGTRLMQNYNTSSTSFTVPRLHPYRQYSYRVAAYTSVGVGNFTDPSTIRTNEEAPSGAPIVNHSSLTPTSRSILLEWEPPLLEERNGNITQYTIELVQLDRGLNQTLTTTNTTLTVLGLHPYSVYRYRLAANTSVGKGPFSNFSETQTLQDAPSGHPQNIRLTLVSPTSFQLEWSPPVPEERNGVITGYQLFLEWGQQVEEFREEQTNYTFVQLQYDTVYNCSVAAYTIKGTGPYSDRVTITTPKDVTTIGAASGGALFVLVLCVMGAIVGAMAAKKCRKKKQSREDTIRFSSLGQESENKNIKTSSKVSSKKPKPQHKSVSASSNALSQPDEPRYLNNVDFIPGPTPQRYNSTGDSPALSEAESEAGSDWLGEDKSTVCTPQQLTSPKQTGTRKGKYENADIIASSKEEKSKSQTQQIATMEETDDTIPELPSRSYLNDTEFIHELNTELFPEIGHQTLVVPVGNSMLPELPERRYLEDTDFEIQATPTVPDKRKDKRDQLHSMSSSGKEDKRTDGARTKHGNSKPKQASQLKSLYSNIDIIATEEPTALSKHTAEIKPPSEGQYMSLCEATRDRSEEYQNKENPYMSLSESTRERGRIVPWGQRFT